MTWARKERRAAAPLELPSTVPVDPPPPPPPPPPAGFGPNAPVGLETPFPVFTGDALPTAVGSGAAVMNAFGMGGYHQDLQMLRLVDDAASSSGKALRCTYPGLLDPDFGMAFVPNDFGGAAPSRYMLRSDLRPLTWRTLYLRARRRFSAAISVYGTTATATVHVTGTATAGSSPTTLVDAARTWAPDEHVGRWVRHGARKGIRIIGNTATQLLLAPGYRFNYTPVGEGYTIFSVSDGADGWNAGTKGLCFPRIAARLTGSQLTPGGGDGFGTPWSHDAVGPTGDNGVILGWRNFNDTLGGEGLSHRFEVQWPRVWNSPWTEDGNGLPVWNESGDSSQYPPSAGSKLTYTPGAVTDEEYVLTLNTPGSTDGVYRHWFNGALVQESVAARYVPAYVDAIQAGVQVVLGGSARRVALAVSEPRWDYLYSDVTYGGGIRVPITTFHVDLLDLAVGGIPW